VTSIWQKSEKELADSMETARFPSCAQERIYTGKYFDENRLYTNCDTLKRYRVQRRCGWFGNFFCDVRSFETIWVKIL